MAKRTKTEPAQEPAHEPAQESEQSLATPLAAPAAPAENEQVAALRAEVQEVLDRFAAHQFPLDYETVVGYAERMTLHTLVQAGALDRDDVMRQALGAQLAILKQEFQARCIHRDETNLVKPQRANDSAAQTGRIVMMRRPKLIVPGR